MNFKLLKTIVCKHRFRVLSHISSFVKWGPELPKTCIYNYILYITTCIYSHKNNFFGNTSDQYTQFKMKMVFMQV